MELQNEILIQKKQLNQICDEFLKDLKLTKELIDIEQSVILKNDKLLYQFFSPEEKPSALYDLPDIIKHVLQFFGWQKDNITLESKITASEVKIEQRNESLVAINGELYDYLIVLRFEQDKSQNLESTKSNFRDLQMKVIRDARQLRKFSRQDTVRKHQKEYFEKF